MASMVSPRTFRLIAAGSVWALALTILSGATVRLSGSGLGCPDWPSCTTTSPVAPLELHAWVEFANRLVNAAVSAAAIGALVAALLRSPRRRDLMLLSAGLLGGLLGQVVLGGLTVVYKLAPGLVMAHFLLAVAVLADAVLLHHRAGLPDLPPTPPGEVITAGRHRAMLVGRTQLFLSRLVLAGTAIAIVLGTVVTSTGPRGGDPSARRFGFSLHAVAQAHGASVEVLLGLTLVMVWSLAASGAPRGVLRRAEVVIAAMAAQAAVGYTQYLSGDPVAVVAVHVAGACLLVVAVLRFHLGLAAHRIVTFPDEPAALGAVPLPVAAA